MAAASRNVKTLRRTPALIMPVQAPPIRRTDWHEPVFDSGSGVEAAQSRCSHLRGLARQMCYATLYGVSV